MLENLDEELDPARDGVLLRQVYKKGVARLQVLIGRRAGGGFPRRTLFPSVILCLRTTRAATTSRSTMCSSTSPSSIRTGDIDKPWPDCVKGMQATRLPSGLSFAPWVAGRGGAEAGLMVPCRCLNKVIT